MRALLCSGLCLGLALPSGPVWAGPPARTPAADDATTDGPPLQDAPAPADDAAAEDPINRAAEAWTAGRWTEVRDLLEPLAGDPDALAALPGYDRTRALLLLADATMSDTSLDEAERRRLATGYLGQQMDADPSWQMLPGVYTKALFDLYVDVSGARSRAEISRCRADVTACKSDVRNEQAAYAELAERHANLEKDFEDQKIEVQKQVARSRVFALIPFGVGQFYNGDTALGAGFLAGEALFGAAGLGLLIYRLVGDGCQRNNGFQSGSVSCTGPDLDAILRRRKAEEAMGWFFYGSMALDILIAQIRFQDTETVEVRRIRRSELESGGGAPSGPRKRRRRNRRKPVVTPTTSMGRHGAGLGFKVRF